MQMIKRKNINVDLVKPYEDLYEHKLNPEDSSEKVN